MDKRNDISRDDLDKNGMTPPTFTSDAEEVKTDGTELAAETSQTEAETDTAESETVSEPEAVTAQSEAQTDTADGKADKPDSAVSSVKKPFFNSEFFAKNKRLIIGVTAAVLAIIIAIVVIVLITRKPPVSVELPGGLSVLQYRDSGDIKSTVKKLNDKAKKEENKKNQLTEFVKKAVGEDGLGLMKNDSVDSFLASIIPESLLNSVAGALSYDDTYKIYEGVEEPDIIKTDGKYIFCVNNSYSADSIAVFSAEDGKSEKIADIYADSDHETPEDAIFEYLTEPCYIMDFYLNNNKLIALCNDMRDRGGENETVTRAIVFDISDINNPSIVDSFTQSGALSSSRMIGDTLYTVSEYTPAASDLIPMSGKEDNVNELSPESVYSLKNPVSPSYYVISAFNTGNPSFEPAVKAILGGADDIYYGGESIYIYATDWEYYNKLWDGSVLDMLLSEGEDGEEIAGITSSILKVSLNDKVDLSAYAEIDGEIYDKCAFDESGGDLRVVTTGYYGLEEINNLYVLDDELGVKGSVSGFAKDEYIDTVRYIGDTAYVVTYNESKPLSVIDLSDPKAPKIKDSVDTTGFSGMLVPVGDDKLLSIGYCNEEGGDGNWMTGAGMKLTLFDVSDRFAPKALDSKSYLKYYSEVQGNPKALVYNPDRGDYVIPLNYDENYSKSDKDAEEHSDTSEGGMLNFKLSDGKIIESAKQKADSQYIDRCVYVGDHVYMTSYDKEELELLSAEYVSDKTDKIDKSDKK